MTELIAGLALFISLLSLFINWYRIYRDKNKLITWSEIISTKTLKDNKEHPVLKIYAVNVGLRPITLIKFGFYSKSKKFYVETNINPLSDVPSDIFDPEFDSIIVKRTAKMGR